MSQSTSDHHSWSMVRQVLSKSYSMYPSTRSLQKLLNSEMTVDQDVDLDCMSTEVLMEYHLSSNRHSTADVFSTHVPLSLTHYS